MEPFRIFTYSSSTTAMRVFSVVYLSNSLLHLHLTFRTAGHVHKHGFTAAYSPTLNVSNYTSGGDTGADTAPPDPRRRRQHAGRRGRDAAHVGGGGRPHPRGAPPRATPRQHHRQVRGWQVRRIHTHTHTHTHGVKHITVFVPYLQLFKLLKLEQRDEAAEDIR